jgi:hypothetical protein
LPVAALLQTCATRAQATTGIDLSTPWSISATTRLDAACVEQA